MHQFIILTVAVLTMFSVTITHAKEEPALIVIAADQSESMFDSKHVEIQREALITAFANYVVDCNNLEVRYIAWGGSVAPPVTAKLINQEAVIDYANSLWPVTHAMLKTTDHSLGVAAAVDQLEASKAKHKVLVFTTDGVSNEPRNWGLGSQIPRDVTVFTISLGTTEVSNFVVKNIQPSTGGEHFHADNADELASQLEEAFKAAKAELCLS